MNDPRSFKLPEGFFWSRRIIDDSGTGRWCVVYDSRFACIVGNPADNVWTQENVEQAVERMRPIIASTEREVQMKILTSEWVGGTA